MKKIKYLLCFSFVLVVLGVIVVSKNLKFFIVESGSMQPTLNIGELIVVKGCNQYCVGEIITYYDECFKGYVTHRIIQNDKGKFITKGDYNNTVDEKTVDINSVVGKVIFHNKTLGLMFYRYKYIVILTLMISLIFVNVYSVIFKGEKDE